MNCIAPVFISVAVRAAFLAIENNQTNDKFSDNFISMQYSDASCLILKPFKIPK